MNTSTTRMALAFAAVGIAIVGAFVASFVAPPREIASSSSSAPSPQRKAGLRDEASRLDDDHSAVDFVDARPATALIRDAELDGASQAETAKADGGAPPSIEKALVQRIAATSREGDCATFFAGLRGAFGRFIAQEKRRVAGVVVPDQDASYASRRVESAALAVAERLPEHLCRSSAAGTWAVVYDDFGGRLADDMTRAKIDTGAADGRWQPASDPSFLPSYHVRATGWLVFLSAKGLGRMERPFPVGSATLLAIATNSDGAGADVDALGDLEAGDTDGDGIPEALLLGRHGWVDFIEGPDSRARVSVVYTAKSGNGIQPLASVPPGVVFRHLVDADGDGLADLTSPDPFFGLEDGNLGKFEIEGPTFVLHATRGGGFSRDDAAARAFALKSCPTRPTRLLVDPPAADADMPVYMTDARDEAIRQTACARLWGVSPTTVRRWLAEVRGGAELTRWAGLAPPLNL